MSQSAILATKPPQGGLKALWLVLALFALPMVMVAGLYALGWRPAGSGNYGELVVDTPPLPLAELRGADGQPLPVQSLAGRWTLLVAAPADCAQACREHLDLTRRLHVALYKNMPRLHRLLLAPAPGGDPALPAIRAAWPDLVVASTGNPHWRSLLGAIAPGEVLIFVLDPDGRPVLRYTLPFDARRALRDVDRLLKLSWIG